MCQLTSIALSFASRLVWENTLLAGHSEASVVLKASALLHVQQHNERSSHVNRTAIKSALHSLGMMRNNGDIDLLLRSSERARHLFGGVVGFIHKIHSRLWSGRVSCFCAALCGNYTIAL